MILLKIYYHILCAVKLVCYYFLYGKAIKIPLSVTFRKGFHIVIEGNGRLCIGRRVFFNNYCSLCSMSQITIGDESIFGENVKIYDHNHIYSNLDIPIKKQGYTTAPIHIGKHCWIGSNVVILKGVTIGDNCVIGAGCIVYKDVPDGTLLINKQDLRYK